MVSAPSVTRKPVCGKGHIGVGAALGWSVYWLLMVVAAWSPGPQHHALEKSLVRFAHWPFLVFLPGMVHAPEGEWEDVVPLIVSIAVWTAIGMIAGLALCLIRTRHENRTEDVTGSS